MLFTRGASLPVERQLSLQDAVRRFQTFTEENDPHGEHDFGMIVRFGQKFFWKIDYFENSNMELGGDPYREDVFRVLTVMRAYEY